MRRANVYLVLFQLSSVIYETMHKIMRPNRFILFILSPSATEPFENYFENKLQNTSIATSNKGIEHMNSAAQRSQ